jgi:hypothetical protein
MATSAQLFPSSSAWTTTSSQSAQLHVKSPPATASVPSTHLGCSAPTRACRDSFAMSPRADMPHPAQLCPSQRAYKRKFHVHFVRPPLPPVCSAESPPHCPVFPPPQSNVDSPSHSRSTPMPRSRSATLPWSRNLSHWSQLPDVGAPSPSPPPR